MHYKLDFATFLEDHGERIAGGDDPITGGMSMRGAFIRIKRGWVRLPIPVSCLGVAPDTAEDTRTMQAP